MIAVAIAATVDRARSLSTASFQLEIEKKILQQAKSNTELRSASSWDFGVILIYGGGRREDTSDGVRVAQEIQKKLNPDPERRWRKVRLTTFYETGFTNEVSYGSVKLKLFPIISK